MIYKFFKTYTPIFALIMLVSGCAHQSAQGNADDPFSTQDQLAPINRPIFGFNLYFDKFFMRPVNGAYDVLPELARAGIDNFFTNLSEPLNVVEGALQLNPDIAFTSLSRFIMNSTVGIGGFYDYAAAQGLTFQDQSGGKTLAVWGIPQGSYLVIPFLGPSTVRETVGDIADWFMDPMGYVLNTPEQIIQTAGDAVTDSDERRAVINQIYYRSPLPYEAGRATFLRNLKTSENKN